MQVPGVQLNQFQEFEKDFLLFGLRKIDTIFDKWYNWCERLTMFLLFIVTITWVKLKLAYPTTQVYKTRCMVFSLLCYHVSFTQLSNQGLFSFCQNVSFASHTSIKTEWSNFMKFAIIISTKAAYITSQCRSWFTWKRKHSWLQRFPNRNKGWWWEDESEILLGGRG